jgi:hypothetical protein
MYNAVRQKKNSRQPATEMLLHCDGVGARRITAVLKGVPGDKCAFITELAGRNEDLASVVVTLRSPPHYTPPSCLKIVPHLHIAHLSSEGKTRPATPTTRNCPRRHTSVRSPLQPVPLNDDLVAKMPLLNSSPLKRARNKMSHMYHPRL